MGPRFRRVLLCAFVLLAVAGNFNGAHGSVDENIKGDAASSSIKTSTPTTPKGDAGSSSNETSTPTTPTGDAGSSSTETSTPTGDAGSSSTETSTPTTPTGDAGSSSIETSTPTTTKGDAGSSSTETSTPTTPTGDAGSSSIETSTPTTTKGDAGSSSIETSTPTTPTGDGGSSSIETSTATTPKDTEPGTQQIGSTTSSIADTKPETQPRSSTISSTAYTEPETQPSSSTISSTAYKQPQTQPSSTTISSTADTEPQTQPSSSTISSTAYTEPKTQPSSSTISSTAYKQPQTQPSSSTISSTADTEPQTQPSSTTVSSPAAKCPDINVTICESVPYRHCEMRNGEPECYCEKGLMKKGDKCEIVKKLTVRFQITNFRRRRDASPTKECSKNITRLIETIKKAVPNVDESTIVCSGTDVSFDVFVENAAEEEKVKQKFEKCNGPDCKLGTLSFSAPEVKIKQQCEELKAVAKGFGMECENSANGAQFVCNKNKTRVVGSTELNGVQFYICKPLPCNETCKDERRHCLLESCVCKPQFKYDSETGECQSICEAVPNLCHSEAKCLTGENYQSFYCRCPAKRTGPLCQYENRSFQSAQLNIVIVGVVLSSLLLMCFVVSASIISRLKKKLEGPNFKKDPERNGQRELRGYDGPYRASDPASLRRERDYTSL